MLVIQMYLWKPSGCSMLTSVVWTSLRQFRYEMEVVRMSYVYKCRLNFLEAVRIWEAHHVYPDGGDPDVNACHVSPWGAWHVFSEGRVPTIPPFLTCPFCPCKMGGLKIIDFLKLRLLFCAHWATWLTRVKRERIIYDEPSFLCIPRQHVVSMIA